jgi:tetratricopeptide (TPR) repeat protein
VDGVPTTRLARDRYSTRACFLLILAPEDFHCARCVIGKQNRSFCCATVAQLAPVLDEEGKRDEAEKLEREVVEKRKRLLGPEAFPTLAAMDNLSVCLAHEGKLEEAEKLERETLDIQLRVFGRENLGTIYSMLNLADIQRDMGRDQDAEKLLREVLGLEVRVLGPDQLETAETKYDLACVLARRGQSEEALSLLHQAVDHGLEPRIDFSMEKEPRLEAASRRSPIRCLGRTCQRTR